jgi:ribosomal protein S18 acetylase RimI-like enzyme
VEIVEVCRGSRELEDAAQIGAEVSYVGVRPSRWGRGVGELLLRRVHSRLATAGYTSAELSAYIANVRAVALY